jgi:hypothetical protein
VAGITAGIVTLLLSAVMVIVGSVGDWATISFGPVSIGAAGTNRAIAHDYGVDGWVTFGLGIVLAILAVLMVVSAEDALRSLGILLSFLSLGFAVYFFIRIVHDVLKAHPGRFAPPGSGVDVGWGVIVLLIGAVGAFAGAVSEAR